VLTRHFPLSCIFRVAVALWCMLIGANDSFRRSPSGDRSVGTVAVSVEDT